MSPVASLLVTREGDEKGPLATWSQSCELQVREGCLKLKQTKQKATCLFGGVSNVSAKFGAKQKGGCSVVRNSGGGAAVGVGKSKQTNQGGNSKVMTG